MHEKDAANYLSRVGLGECYSEVKWLSAGVIEDVMREEVTHLPIDFQWPERSQKLNDAMEWRRWTRE